MSRLVNQKNTPWAYLPAPEFLIIGSAANKSRLHPARIQMLNALGFQGLARNSHSGG